MLEIEHKIQKKDLKISLIKRKTQKRYICSIDLKCQYRFTINYLY